MAEFSKECGFDWEDFSIKEIFDDLEDGNYISQICESFGFLAIGKDGDTCIVAMPIAGRDGHQWHKFNFDTNTIGEQHG